MNINNIDTYSHGIYRAIIVNNNMNADPDKNGRIQIFIPDLQPNYTSIVASYISDSNKSSNSDRTKYPWAITLVPDLKNGDEVYISTIQNESGKFIILGKSVYSPNNSYSLYTGDLSVSKLLELTMPCILHEEVGIDYTDYPDNISNNAYGNINCADPNTMSIGLIQWHDVRAHDCLFQCCKADNNWRNYWEDKSTNLYKSLDNSISAGDNSNYRTAGSIALTRNTSNYNGVYNTLTSVDGKKAQLSFASLDTQEAIDSLINTYEVTNPAIIIFCADIMNQYGSGINNSSGSPNLRGCLNKAREISIDGSGMSNQLDEYINWWKSKTNNYLSRRDRVAAYIKGLISQGKLVEGNDLTNNGSGSTEQGQFIWPCDSRTITSYVGSRTAPLAGASTDHQGMDIGLATGSNIYASAAGTAYTMSQGANKGYGHYIVINHHNGYWTLYAHLQNYQIRDGQNVSQGQVIAISDNTGNSTGPHLHFELKQWDGDSYPFKKAAPLNPLMYLPGGQEIWNKHIS